MANILQVTPPNINPEQQIQNSQRVQPQGQSPVIQNPVDPNSVNRADRQETGQSGTATGEGAGLILRPEDFEGTYAGFIRLLGQTADLPIELYDALFGDGAMILFRDQEGLREVLDELFSTIEMEDPEQLQKFVEDQQQAQVRFSGPFFNGIRGMLSEKIPDSLRSNIMDFLKSYVQFTSGDHYLTQMETLTKDINSLLLKSYQGEFEALTEQIDWEALPGDTKGNMEVIQNQVIPFLSRYISKTHDYGPVRNAVMHFILFATKYSGGDRDEVSGLLNKLMRNQDFHAFFKGDPLEAWDANVEKQKEADSVNRFADSFSRFLLEGASGKAGPDTASKFQRVMNGLLVNESVYMPLLHVVVPFRYDGREVMSEMWVDPEAGEGEAVGKGNKAMKVLLKFNIQRLGDFEMVTMMKDRRVDMQLYLPKEIYEDRQKEVEEVISGILRRNGLSVANVGVFRKVRDLRLLDIFPNIRKQEKGINIRI